VPKCSVIFLDSSQETIILVKNVKEFIMKHIIFLLLMVMTGFSLCMAEETEIVPREAKLPDMIMVGVQIIDSMEQEAYMKLWEEFFEIDEKVPEATGDAYYGISFATRNAEGKDAWGYMVATQVKSVEKLPEGLVSRKIPARNYIVFEHHGPVEKIGGLYEYIYGKYGQSGKHKLLYAESLERYDHRFKEGSEDSLVEIWVPVE